MATDLNGKSLPKGITQRPDGRYMGRFTFGGERYTLYNHDLKKLRKELADLQYEVEHGLYAKETKVTVESWFHTWMEEYKKNSVKYGTYENYGRVYTQYIRDRLGKRKLADIRPEHIQSINKRLAKDGYSHKTISLTAIVLGGMFKQAYKNQMIQRNPVELASIPRNTAKKKNFRVMTPEEQKTFLKHAADSPCYHLYVVALGTGMRAGELRALEWSDIDFQNRTIHVHGTLKFHKGKGYVKDTPKTASSDREIPMLEEVYSHLRQQRKAQAELRLSLGDKWTPEPGLENLVFLSEYARRGFGTPISSSALNIDIKKIVKQINESGTSFESITPHTLRHTFATRGLENGITPKVMQELLGHTSITMTLDIYSHVLPDKKASEIQKIAGMF